MSSAQIIERDGMFFNLNDSQRDIDLYKNEIEDISSYLSEGQYSDAEVIVNRLLNVIRKNSPAGVNPSDERYSIRIYSSLKYWEQMLRAIRDIKNGRLEQFQIYTGNIVSIDMGSGRNCSGHIGVKSNGEEKDFFVDCDFIITKWDELKVGKNSTLYYIIQKSLDNPYIAIKVALAVPSISQQPIILTIDGICPMATFNIISNNTCWTNYLKEALAPQLTQYLVTSFQWTGDTKETPNTLKYAEKFIRDFYKVAQNRGTTFQIVAHSWGTVLAYAILKANPDIKVNTLITLGSPLRSQEKLIIENYTNLYAGSNIQKLGNVTQWINYWAWNDLISGKIDVADKNVQIDTGIDNTDYQTRVMATRDFHSKYFTDWKYLIISDLSSLSDKNNQSEIIIAIQKDNLENTGEDLLFPVAYIKDMQYHEISVSALNEREVTSKDLQVKSLLSNIKKYMMISDGVKTGTFDVSNVRFREGLSGDNAYIPEGKIHLIQETANYRNDSHNTLFLSSVDTSVMNNKFIPIKGIASNHINNITNLIKIKCHNLRVTTANNIDASSLKVEYLKAYDLENDGQSELFLVGSSIRSYKAVSSERYGKFTNELLLFMIICLDRNQYRILYSSEPLYSEANLIGALDIDGEGSIEIVINSGIWEDWHFEIYRFQNGILKKLYSGTGYGS
jgi:hypothetical protein